MDLKLIKNILNLISDSDVDEVAIEEGDFKIKVKKTGTVEQVTY
ncbi:MAG TPA: acetyl-CoA carboxylase, biotin carboxyl carrier protein, partial [Balneola sp.]|nr:acetyl-CoA carboxylase, biotin carboxyl carrier protein [Balneola sp.]